jgi:hypothetical protein
MEERFFKIKNDLERCCHAPLYAKQAGFFWSTAFQRLMARPNVGPGKSLTLA